MRCVGGAIRRLQAQPEPRANENFGRDLGAVRARGVCVESLVACAPRPEAPRSGLEGRSRTRVNAIPGASFEALANARAPQDEVRVNPDATRSSSGAAICRRKQREPPTVILTLVDRREPRAAERGDPFAETHGLRDRGRVSASRWRRERSRRTRAGVRGCKPRIISGPAVRSAPPSGSVERRAVGDHSRRHAVLTALADAPTPVNSHSCCGSLWNFQTRFGPAITLR